MQAELSALLNTADGIIGGGNHNSAGREDA